MYGSLVCRGTVLGDAQTVPRRPEVDQWSDDAGRAGRQRDGGSGQCTGEDDRPCLETLHDVSLRLRPAGCRYVG